MRSTLLIVAVILPLLGGCTVDGIQRGASITRVQADYGLPDVISDRSGDQQRFYVPNNRPEYEWPAEAPRTFYYVQRNLAMTFVSGKLVSTSPIDVQLREHLIRPLIDRQAKSTSG